MLLATSRPRSLAQQRVCVSVGLVGGGSLAVGGGGDDGLLEFFLIFLLLGGVVNGDSGRDHTWLV